jgi:formylglycine-generating enzyme required for sulfatase activity
MAFCAEINQQWHGSFPTGYAFSLPTEAQWEYACRAGSTSLYYNGDTEADLDQIAWYAANSNESTHPVGEKTPSSWGFYDMLGNVGEWCFDSCDIYPAKEKVDWVGKGNRHSDVICRGGSWTTSAEQGALWCSSTGCAPRGWRAAWFGFRLYLGPKL